MELLRGGVATPSLRVTTIRIGPGRALKTSDRAAIASESSSAKTAITRSARSTSSFFVSADLEIESTSTFNSRIRGQLPQSSLNASASVVWDHSRKESRNSHQRNPDPRWTTIQLIEHFIRRFVQLKNIQETMKITRVNRTKYRALRCVTIRAQEFSSN